MRIGPGLQRRLPLLPRLAWPTPTSKRWSRTATRSSRRCSTAAGATCKVGRFRIFENRRGPVEGQPASGPLAVDDPPPGRARLPGHGPPDCEHPKDTRRPAMTPSWPRLPGRGGDHPGRRATAGRPGGGSFAFLADPPPEPADPRDSRRGPLRRRDPARGRAESCASAESWFAATRCRRRSAQSVPAILELTARRRPPTPAGYSTWCSSVGKADRALRGDRPAGRDRRHRLRLRPADHRRRLVRRLRPDALAATLAAISAGPWATRAAGGLALRYGGRD